MENIKQMLVMVGSVLVLTAMIVPGVSATNSAAIMGHVYNETGAPLAEVNVTWENAIATQLYDHAITVADGGYAMDDTFSGQRESLITATKSGYYPNSTIMLINGTTPATFYFVDFTLESDVTPPDITNLQPSDGAIINDATPTISAEYSDAAGINVSTVTMSVDGIEVTGAAITESSISYVPTSLLLGGERSVDVYVEDANGNPATTDWSFTVDTIAPVVNIISPENITYMVDTVDLNCTATDPNNVSVVWYSLDGGANVTINATDEQWYNTTLTDLATGLLHCITVYANDTAGNIGSDSKCFNIEASVWVNVSLLEGWNMIGTPLNVTNWTLPAVLDSIDGHYDVINYFNATTDEMEYYYAAFPEFSDFQELEPGAGYLLHMTASDTLQWHALKFEALSRYLEIDWNMFSVPYGIENKTLPPVLDSIDGHYDVINYFNATTDEMEYYYAAFPEFSDFQELEPCAGYLIHMTASDTFVAQIE